MASCLVLYCLVLTLSVIKLLKKRLVTALSKQLLLRLILAVIPCVLSKR